MIKKYLSVMGLAILCRINAVAQAVKDSIGNNQLRSDQAPVKNIDSTGYQLRKLKLDEIDFVTSYYAQNGDHSAVTGGIGTENVKDISNALTLNLVWFNKHRLKNTLGIGLGFDYHTAASQAFVSPTGASKKDGTRLYPSLDWSVENDKKGYTFGIGAYYSNEFNYKSLGADLNFSQKTKDKSGEFSAKLQGYFDNVTLIYPTEFMPGYDVSDPEGKHKDYHYGTSPRKTLTASLSYLQQVNKRLQVMFLADAVVQNGYLGLPFHRVYFNNGKDTIEHLPSSRFKLPLGIRLNYFLGDNIVIRTYYRYYSDNWGIHSNTAQIELPYKITPFVSIAPFYRFYNQSASKYFAPYEQHSPSDEYYTSNYEYSKFTSSFYGVNFRFAPPKGVLGWQHLHDLEIRYGHYTQTTDLVSNVISLAFGFK
ncbi:MAG TPA: DUF3570 domain-containing protein [Arachidicoccus sp.]